MNLPSEPIDYAINDCVSYFSVITVCISDATYPCSAI